HLDAQAETAARRIPRVRVVLPRVVEVVVHHRVTLLIRRGALAAVAVPAAAPPGIVRIVELVGPAGRPRARVVADRRRLRPIEAGVGLEVARPRLEAHHAIQPRADLLPFAEPRLHERDVLAVDRVDLRE